MIARGLIWSAVPLGAILGFALWGWLAVEPGAQIAVHWGPDGRPDRFGSRLEAFGVMPLIASGLLALFVIIPGIDPRGANLKRSPALFLTAWLGTLWVLAAAQGALTLNALGLLQWGEDAVARIVLGVVGLLFAAIGNVMGKARPNWFVGLRTPWTLSSDRAWDVSHRWAGRFFVIGGLATLLCVLFLPVIASVVAIMMASLGGAIVSTVISYLVWRKDPERETYTAAD